MQVVILGIDWVCPLLAKDLILGWSCLPIRKRARKLWKTTPLCLFWAIWMERNRIVFDRDGKLTSKFGYPPRPAPFGTGMEIYIRVWDGYGFLHKNPTRVWDGYEILATRPAPPRPAPNMKLLIYPCYILN